MIPGIPYWRLSAFYLCYFAVLGAMVPYWPVYLQDRGFDAEAIGILTAIMMLARVIAPNLWGWLADHTSQRIRIVRGGALLATLSFAGIFLDESYFTLVVVIILHSFFWNALLAQYEVVTFDYLKNKPEGYARIRLWGSVGFIVAVAAVGALMDVIRVSHLPLILLGCMALVCLSSWLVEEAPRHETLDQSSETIWQIMKKPPVICFFTVCLLMQVSHGPYYTFFSLYMEQHGHSRTQIGQLWALGVLAEVVLFWYMHRLMPAWGVRTLMLLSLLLSGVRWALIGLFPDSLPIILLAQCLHAFSFGAFHATAIEVVRRAFPAKQAARGQALYNSLSFGVGNAIGALASGYLWEWSNQWTFLLAGAVTLLAWAIAWKGLKPEGS
jgi:PPP family 3-phenylpropionic acid transporter